MKTAKLSSLFPALLAVTASLSCANANAEAEKRIYWEAESASSIHAPLQKVLNDPDRKVPVRVI